jgi:hypothetical protein
MSDISILSGRYDTIAKLSNKLNEAILLLKKAALKAGQPAPPATRVNEGSETDKAREFLGKFLGDLAKTLGERFSADATMPHSVFEALQKLSQNEPNFDQALNALHYRLTHYQDLTLENLALLDKLLAVVDTEGTAVFRKLWRKR